MARLDHFKSSYPKLNISNILEKQIIEILVVTAVVWIPKVKGTFREGGCQASAGVCGARGGAVRGGAVARNSLSNTDCQHTPTQRSLE